MLKAHLTEKKEIQAKSLISHLIEKSNNFLIFWVDEYKYIRQHLEVGF